MGFPRGGGAVVAVRVLDPDGDWLPLYANGPLHDGHDLQVERNLYWDWSPQICRPHFYTSVVRIELDTSAETGMRAQITFKKSGWILVSDHRPSVLHRTSS